MTPANNPLQLSLGVNQPHNNRGLFSDHYSEKLLPAEHYGWASFIGKITYLDPAWPEALGNHEFKVYVEDRNEPGGGIDQFWIEVIDKDGLVVPDMSMDRDDVDNTVDLDDGNVVVPHQ